MNITRITRITLFVAVASACVAGEQTHTPEAFWSEFRQAVAEEDIQEIASLTRFPFKTRGVHDGMPVVTYDEEAFVEIFPLILDTEVPRQLEEGSVTLKQSILEKKSLDSEHFSSEDQLWIGDFKFDQTDEGWRLSFVYWSEDQAAFFSFPAFAGENIVLSVCCSARVEPIPRLRERGQLELRDGPI